ncbi:MAG: hypothetical protein HOC72_00105, partial [Rhodospirillaceae bacterium]|nr:hypothetical protein [Rhodospirillaceae bacterium]
MILITCYFCRRNLVSDNLADFLPLGSILERAAQTGDIRQVGGDVSVACGIEAGCDTR